MSYFQCVSGHPNHKGSVVGLDIYHDHFLCVLTLLLVFSEELSCIVISSYPGLTFYLFCEFLPLVMVARLLLKVHFLKSLFLAASCLSNHFLFVQFTF